MVRVEDLNITFFHLPKNAGSSIATWLTDNVNGEEYMDDFRHASPRSLKPMFDDFGWSFCCVRNPWDRTVSWYNFFHKQYKNINKGINIPFEEYMDKLINEDYTSKYIKPIGHQYKTCDYVDYVIKYETLTHDFKKVQEKVKCFKPLNRVNKSIDADYTQYYTKDSYVNWVGEYYAKDIMEFNYSFGG